MFLYYFWPHNFISLLADFFYLCNVKAEDNMNTKALFFDIDGTLVSFQTHRIPQSAVDALTLAHSRGVKIIIATGRPMAIVSGAVDQISSIIDGYLTVNGARCLIDGHTVSMEAIPQQDVDNMKRIADERNICTIFVSEDDMYIYRHQPIFDRLFYEGLGITYEPKPWTPEIMQRPILQFTPFYDVEDEALVMGQLPHCISTRWHPEFTDIISRRADKGKGLEAMAQALGITTAETMCFGDGGNDVSMYHSAGIGVAMGNAVDEVKAQADYVTDTVDDDGVANALKHFGVI